MTTRDAVVEVLEKLPEHRVKQVLDFAQFLQLQDTGDQETAEWRRLALAHFDAGYGPDEPEYTLSDIKPELDS